jgi:hypothetical protein
MKRFLVMLMVLIVCVGCKQLNKDIDKQPDSVVEAELEVDNSEFVLDYTAQNIELAVRASLPFEVEVNVDWISHTIADSGDRVVLAIAENSSTEPRLAELVITAGELSATVVIEQGVKPELMELLLEHSSAHLDSPAWDGYDIKGSVDWGDGTTEEYRDGISHDYADAQRRSAQFNMEGATSFYIESIGDIESITLSI